MTTGYARQSWHPSGIMAPFWDFGIEDSLLLFSYLFMIIINLCVLEIGGYNSPREFKVWCVGKKAMDLLLFYTKQSTIPSINWLFIPQLIHITS